MAKSTFIIIALLVIGGVVAGSFLMIRKTPEINNPEQKTNHAASLESKPEITPELDSAKSGQYVAYTPEVFAQTNAGRRVFFFYANWCSTCRPADADFVSNADQLPADVAVIRVNYNDNETDVNEKELANKYNITYQHTFVQIDSDGQEVAKWNGGKSKELLQNLK